MSQKTKNNFVGTYFITHLGVIRVVMKRTCKYYKVVYFAAPCPVSICSVPDFKCSVCPISKLNNSIF